MNKRITTDVGGFPFVLDDLRFEEDAVREAFRGILSTWGLANEDSIILSGCEVTITTTTDIATGYVAIGGEVYFVPAHSISNTIPPGTEPAFVVSTSFDAAGLKTFDSGGTFDTYQIRRALVQYVTVSATNFKLFSAKTLDEKIAEQSGEFLGSWTNINLDASADVVQVDGGGSNFTPAVAPGPGSFLRYNKIGKRVHVTFRVLGLGITSFVASNCVSVRIKGLPFTMKSGIEQYGNYLASSPSHTNTLQGVHPIISDAGSSAFRCRLFGWDGSYKSFNRAYELQGIPLKALTATAADTFTPTFNLEGSFTFETE